MHSVSKNWLAVLLALAAAMPVWAGGERLCCHCRGCPASKQVCRWVPEKKTIEVERWDCECETICIPGRSKNCGKTCPADCDCKQHVQHHWSPTCAKVRTVKKLKKVKEVKEVCTWKWVVEEVCDHCAGKCDAALLHQD